MITTGFISPGGRRSRPWLAAVLALLAPAGAFAATITVDTNVDDDLADGECSLREAILAANTDLPRNDCPAGSGPDRIVFTLAKGATIQLGAALPTITDTLLVRGPGADLLAIDGQDLYSMLNFDPPTLGRWLGVEELTLTRGLADTGGGASISSGQNGGLFRVVFYANRANIGGGGIYIRGEETASSRVDLDECWFRENESLGPTGGGGLAAVQPGLEVRVDRTTFSGNRATGGGGGGLNLSRAILQIDRSTFSANEAADSGGAIVFLASTSPASLTLRNVTITANRANSDADADGRGGGIALLSSVGQTVTLELVNSILAGNFDDSAAPAPDASLPAASPLTLTSAGFNLVGTHQGAETFFAAGNPNAAADYVGTAATPIAPQLLGLADNGGFAPDHRPAIVAGTPLIDQGFCPGATADQRGYGDAVNHLRIVDTAFANGPGSDGCDIGSHERAGDPGADPELFTDGFEWGHSLRWSTEFP